MNLYFNTFKKIITHPLKFRIFLLTKLPVAFFAWLRVDHLTEGSAGVSVRQTWFNKNPFHSIYFGVLAMAAEVSTGVLCIGYVYKRKPAVSMLVIKSEGFFYKKAAGKIVFTCADGVEIENLIEQSIQSGEGRTVVCNTKGLNEAGEIVAEFNFTWSFKAKSKA